MKKYLLIATLYCVCLLPASNAQSIEILKEINTTGTSNSYPFDFTIANKKLFFIASGNAGGYSLWSTNGNGVNTKMISPKTVPLVTHNSLPLI